ncbi:glycerophosphodiester phosphodiesterase [Larkinella rosea]|uniref:Glycerophosphodiester phosphodiesterase n=1 Tax=Larkinella rosea TaxID=2025312 RepID=A0A3P1BSQ6_9BACT|nr:glycerophosphodiester phosphodiesterase family protein [Larkinella rosea]RRB03953.1 glycerophosphodiester phosphodiesterase [Larkinella rosea]
MKTAFFSTAFVVLLSTCSVVQSMGQTKVIAHRGAWKNSGAPQNSIASLQQAIKLGCYGSEFDVHMTADSSLVVNHDHDLQGVHLETAPAADIQALKLANGESLPTLESYLKEGLKQKKTRLILEVKASKVSKEHSLALATKCVQTVKAMKGRKLVDYISFDYDVCKKVKELDPSANVAYLMGDKAPELLAADGLYGLDYNQAVMKKNENWIQEAHQKKLTVNVWTVNDPEMMNWLLERKADFITTDEPEKLLEKVK